MDILVYTLVTLFLAYISRFKLELEEEHEEKMIPFVVTILIVVFIITAIT